MRGTGGCLPPPGHGAPLWPLLPLRSQVVFSSECSIEQTIDSSQMEEGWKTGRDDGGGPLGEVQKQNISSKLTLRKKGVGGGETAHFVHRV